MMLMHKVIRLYIRSATGVGFQTVLLFQQILKIHNPYTLPSHQPNLLQIHCAKPAVEVQDNG